MLNIVVVDSNAVFRYGLSVLAGYPEFRMIGDGATTSEAIAKLGELQPDIVIMDTFTSGGEDIEAITLMQQKFPDAKVIIFTASNKEEDFAKAIRAGARGYLPKSAGLTELVESIRLVAGGNTIVSPVMAIRLPGEFEGMNKNNNDKFNSLSTREKDVLRLVAQGASNKEIGAHYCVSETRVKTHLRRILEKLNAKNRTQAVALATRKGLLT